MKKGNYETPCIKMFLMQDQDVITASTQTTLSDGKDNLGEWTWFES